MRFDDFADTHHITEPVDTGIICLIKKKNGEVDDSDGGCT